METKRRRKRGGARWGSRDVLLPFSLFAPINPDWGGCEDHRRPPSPTSQEESLVCNSRLLGGGGGAWGEAENPQESVWLPCLHSPAYLKDTCETEPPV